MTYRSSLLATLLLLAPALAAPQDPLPVPKGDTVAIRAVNGKFELKGVSSPNFFEFTQQCQPVPWNSGSNSASTVRLTLPFDMEGGPNDSLDRSTVILREAVAQGMEVSVEPSSEAGKQILFAWSKLSVFKGVIETFSVKYTLFLPDGTPVRATASITFKQAERVSSKPESEEAGQPGKKQPDCSPKQHE